MGKFSKMAILALFAGVLAMMALAGCGQGRPNDDFKESGEIGAASYTSVDGTWLVSAERPDYIEIRSSDPDHRAYFTVEQRDGMSAQEALDDYLDNFGTMDLNVEEIELAGDTWIRVDIMDGQAVYFIDSPSGNAVALISLFDSLDDADKVAAGITLR